MTEHYAGCDDLIARLESAPASSRVLDEEIATHLWGEPRPSGNVGGPRMLVWWHNGVGHSVAPEFTTSLDAALPGERIRFVLLMGNGRWEAEAIDAAGEHYYKAEAATEALARRAAALKARASVPRGT